MGILMRKAQLFAPLGAMRCCLALDCWDCERIGLAHGLVLQGGLGWMNEVGDGDLLCA
jgi:hypothetical protein